MLLGGQQALGAETVAIAAASIRARTLECSLSSDCDLDVFFAAYDYLLEEQSSALQNQSFRLIDYESEPEVEAAAQLELDPEPYRADEAEIQRSVNLFKGTDLRELIHLNGPVKAALDDWLTWMRPNLMSSWHNYQFLRSQMAPIYEEAGLPEALLFGMLATESGGKVHSYSRAGATGPLQFMRATGRAYGLGDVDGFDQRLDPAAATRANVAYLNNNLALFNNDLEKVLAAYNGGESRMRRIQRSYGSTTFWDRRVYYQFPRETRDYVPRVLAAAWLFLEPERYHLELPNLDTETTRLTLREAASLGELTVCLGQEGSQTGWFRTLRNLNPRQEPGKRVEAGDAIVFPARLVATYEAECVGTTLIAEARQLNEANYPAQPSMIPYRVQNGDTLGRIAARYPCVGIRELAEINRVRAPRYMIRVGQTLRIPDCR
jgi:membrane-bound lytic murein transglycosylase D